MTAPLTTYLNDHLGGAQVAIQVLESMREQHDDPRFREFARNLIPEIQADDVALRSIVEKIGASPSTAKRAGGWLLEKAARLKLGHTGSTNFETFESLELLALGIFGKLSLWKALQSASKRDHRLHQFDFDDLILRAEQQYEQVERQRLQLAGSVLLPPTAESA
jgi:hypothetical protein